MRLKGTTGSATERERDLSSLKPRRKRPSLLKRIKLYKNIYRTRRRRETRSMERLTRIGDY